MSSDILRPNDNRSTAKIHRLPVGKKISFKFPSKVNPEIQSKYRSRKVKLISRKIFVNPSERANLFIGSLKIN